jgi:succinyl-CoA synthetase beta subunit
LTALQEATEEEVLEAANELLGKKLVTHQTGPQGKVVYRLYVEEATEIEKELYVALVLDRVKQRVSIVASSEGGMEIEEVAKTNPDAIIRTEIEPQVGLAEFQAREIAFKLGLEAGLVSQAVHALQGCYRSFTELDATMVEINPLVITKGGHIRALDAKMGFDSNALFRRPQIAELRDKSQEDPRESAASDRGLSYVGLDGDIGCMINGAGLAMATLDMLKHKGGNPANFLDIGGGASPERVAKAFKLVLDDEGVKAFLVNIFAGINRCDWIAEGIILAFKKLEVKVPLIVRLSGTNVEQGQKILADSGLPIITAHTLAEAAEKAVEARNKAVGA